MSKDHKNNGDGYLDGELISDEYFDNNTDDVDFIYLHGRSKSKFWGYKNRAESKLGENDPIPHYINSEIRDKIDANFKYLNLDYTYQYFEDKITIPKGTNFFHGIWIDAKRDIKFDRSSEDIFLALYPRASMDILNETLRNYDWNYSSKIPVVFVLKSIKDIEVTLRGTMCDDLDIYTGVEDHAMCMINSARYSQYGLCHMKKLIRDEFGEYGLVDFSPAGFEFRCTKPFFQNNFQVTHFAIVDVDKYAKNCSDPDFNILDAFIDPYYVVSK